MLNQDKSLIGALCYLGFAAALMLAPPLASAQVAIDNVQDLPEFSERGWRAFSDVEFFLHASMTLMLAIGLGAVIALHPRHASSIRTVEDTEAPRIYILYAMIGAIVGIMVIKFGLVVGFVLFGIGGLMRFRTVLRSASRTGRVIFVTLVGLACGLELPHVAVLATAFGFVLIWLLDRTLTYHIDVRGIPKDRFVESAAAYNRALAELACEVMSERKDPDKLRIFYTFRCPQRMDHAELVDYMARHVDKELRGAVNWRFE